MQGLININSRQRVILISNMPEKEVKGNVTYNIKTLSEAHPNGVFFTEQYNQKGVNCGNNIWKGGVNFTRVHGVDPEKCSVIINDELITLNFDSETGLISLVTGTNINAIKFIGFLNYKDNNNVDNVQNNLNNEIYGALYNRLNQRKLIFASPVNKIALYFQLEPKPKNNRGLSDSFEENEISIPNVIFTSTGEYIEYEDAYTFLRPDDNELDLLKLYASNNGITDLVNTNLPVYKYTLHIVKSGFDANGAINDLVGYPRALKEMDDPKLYCFNSEVTASSQSVIKKINNDAKREFVCTPIDYNLAIASTQVYYHNSNTQSTSAIVDLKSNSQVTYNISYNVNRNDQSGQFIKSLNNLTGGNGNLLRIRFFDQNNNDVTTRVLGNSSYVTYVFDNDSLQITFKQGFSGSANGYQLLQLRAIPTSFENNATKYIGVDGNYDYPTTLINNFLPLTLEFKENDNKVYAGVYPYYLQNGAGGINLNVESNLTEQNIETLLFGNDNIQSFSCGTSEEMCDIINHVASASGVRYTLQGFDSIGNDITHRNLYIVLPTSWVDRVYITEKHEQWQTTTGSTTIYEKASTTIYQIGKYSLIKTDGYVIDPNNVLLLPASQWKEITV